MIEGVKIVVKYLFFKANAKLVNAFQKQACFYHYSFRVWYMYGKIRQK